MILEVFSNFNSSKIPICINWNCERSWSNKQSHKGKILSEKNWSCVHQTRRSAQSALRKGDNRDWREHKTSALCNTLQFLGTKELGRFQYYQVRLGFLISNTEVCSKVPPWISSMPQISCNFNTSLYPVNKKKGSTFGSQSMYYSLPA